MFAMVFMKLILVAKKALLAYFINSAEMMFVFRTLIWFRMFLYQRMDMGSDFVSFVPITILCGFVVSSIADPSLRNSGTKTIPKSRICQLCTCLFD